MSKAGKRTSGDDVPYILEFEHLALDILKDDTDSEERLRELLEKYANKYAERSTFGT